MGISPEFCKDISRYYCPYYGIIYSIYEDLKVMEYVHQIQDLTYYHSRNLLT